MRNVFCKKYSYCLDECIKRQALDFSCAGCQRFEGASTSAQDFLGACLLLARLYLPEAYQAYQDVVMRERVQKGGLEDGTNS